MEENRFPIVSTLGGMAGGLLGIFVISRLLQFFLKFMGDTIARLLIADLGTLLIALAITHFTMPGRLGYSLITYGTPAVLVTLFDVWRFGRRPRVATAAAKTFD